VQHDWIRTTHANSSVKPERAVRIQSVVELVESERDDERRRPASRVLTNQGDEASQTITASQDEVVPVDNGGNAHHQTACSEREDL